MGRENGGGEGYGCFKRFLDSRGFGYLLLTPILRVRDFEIEGGGMGIGVWVFGIGGDGGVEGEVLRRWGKGDGVKIVATMVFEGWVGFEGVGLRWGVYSLGNGSILPREDASGKRH